MADAFQPKFVDLVRNTTSTQGTGNFVLGPAATGFTSFTAALQPGDSFYYSAIGIDKPAEREVGRGTLQSNGSISRSPINGGLTNFSSGTKSIALIASAEWYAAAQQLMSGGSRSGTAAMADRTALAGNSGTTAYLGEAGREGMFTWSSADLSAIVAADSAQGVCVAPASDPTGKSGAWVRKFNGSYNSLWWGVAEGNTAAQNTAAFRAALTTLAAMAKSGYGYVNGTHPLYTPRGHYLFNDELKPESAVEIYGDSGVQGGGTVFEWTASSGHGIHLQGWDGSKRHAMGSSVRKLHLKGFYNGTRSAQHGIYVNCAAVIEDVFGEYWPGNFIEAFGDVTVSNGNCNGSSFRNVFGQLCDLTLKLRGGDANGCVAENISSSTNRLGTYWDWSFLGCTAVGGIAADNGLDTNYRSRCEKNGHIYVVAYGQEAWCSANSPTGTAASNQGWLYLMDGTTNWYTDTWVAGQTWYFTTPVSVGAPDNANTAGRAEGFYIEGGQNPIVLGPNASCTTTTFATVWLANGTPHGGQTRGSGSNLLLNNSITVPGRISTYGTQHDFGPRSGPAADLNFNFNSTNSIFISFNRFNSAGAQVATDGYLLNAFGTWYLNGTTGVHFRYNNSDVAIAASTGLDLPSGKVLSVAGTQVVGARQTGTPADATDLASALTLVNALKSKLITHGLIA